MADGAPSRVRVSSDESRFELLAESLGTMQVTRAESKEVTSEDGDLVSLLQMVEQLMSLCRSAQKVHA